MGGQISVCLREEEGGKNASSARSVQLALPPLTPQVEIFDYDLVGKNDFLGQVSDAPKVNI